MESLADVMLQAIFLSGVLVGIVLTLFLTKMLPWLWKLAKPWINKRTS